MAEIGKYGKVIFSDKDIQFLKDNFYSMTNDQLAASLNLKKTIVRSKCYELGLKRMELEYWCFEAVEFLKQNYKEIGDVEIAEIFENEFPKNKGWSKKHIEKKRRYLNLKRTNSELLSIHKRNTDNGRFAICNKKRWEATGSNAIGSIVVWNVNGYHLAHIKTENGYVHYARWLWQKHFGEIPKGYNVVRKQGCPEIPTLNFLELISKAEHSRRNRSRFLQLPDDLKEIISIKNKINKTIKKYDNNSRNNR
ncbi:hypothetical protein [Flavobacterium anhuiense]|uniref:hypothetical protein n=1 Tax=Flavobacterium anhuiense TaxID=459526 RepID=UPI000E6BD1F8|nr:hypothetical protein [Flavobacterium anhuiense]